MGVEADRAVAVDKFDRIQWQSRRVDALTGGFSQSGREFLMVECWQARAALGVDEYELLLAAAKVISIPESCIAGQPVSAMRNLYDAARIFAPRTSVVSATRLR